MKKYIKKDFVRLSRKTHGKKYDYSKSSYKNRRTKIEIICPKHGSFFQRPDSHYHNGKGCPTCGMSKPERGVLQFIQSLNMEIETQYKFDDSAAVKNLRYDFCIKMDDGIRIIEYNGRHHYQPIEPWGGSKYLKEVQDKDERKRNHCLKNNIPHLEIHYENKNWKTEVINFLK